MIIKNRYEINTFEIIGQGTYGRVFPCKDLLNKDLGLVAKAITLLPQSDKEKFLKEYEIQNSLQVFLNPHIVKCYHTDLHEDQLIIIMEHCELRDLCKKISEMKKQNQRYNAEQILDFLYQIIDGSFLMYQNKIFHRDMKPSNILLTIDSQNNLVYKISDFGSARRVEDMKKEDNYTRVCSQIYQSPEIKQNEKFSPQSDIFSFGIILYELCFLEIPFQCQYQENFFEQLKMNQFKIDMDSIQGKIEEKNLIKLILENTLVYNKQNRLDWKDLYSLITEFRQPYQQQIIPVQQFRIDSYIIAKQHIYLLIHKQILVKNLMLQFKFCYENTLLQISDEIFKLAFTTLSCCKYILVLSIIAFIHKDYTKLSQNIKNIIVLEKFLDLSLNYQQQLTQEDYDLIKSNDFELKKDEYTEKMVIYSIDIIQKIQQAYPNQFKNLLENLLQFSAYLQNVETFIDYERFLNLQNDLFQTQIAQQFPLNYIGDIKILLALWKAYGQSEVFYPQQICNEIKNNPPDIKFQFNEDEAVEFLQQDLF